MKISSEYMNRVPLRWRGELVDLVVFCLGILFLQSYNAQCISFLVAGFFYLQSLRSDETSETTVLFKRPLPCALKILGTASSVAVILSLRGGLFFIASTLLSLPVFLSFLLILFFTSALKIAAKSQRILTAIENYTEFRSFIWIGCSILILIKLFHLGTNELLPEEAYYWNYASHLSPGYLDHPPMIGWLIAAGVELFGTNEFGVRFFPFLLSHLSLVFIYLFSRDLTGDRAVARLSCITALVLPYVTGGTFYATPDAPLIFFWSAAIYISYRIVESRNPLWFYPAGLVLGLGMLSKYTIILAAASLVLFLLLDRGYRKLLVSKEFLLSLFLATAVFSPVIYWNIENNFASFTFQSTRRLASSEKFSLHLLLLNALYLVTPLGVWASVKFFQQSVVVCFKKSSPDETLELQTLSPYKRKFLSLFFVIPFSIFFFYSIRHVPKLNWIGPAFLALLPVFALQIREAIKSQSFLTLRNFATLWIGYGFIWTTVVAVFFYYLGLSLPLIPYSQKMHRVVGWESFARSAYSLGDRVQIERGQSPVLIGMDKHTIAAELLFYGAKFRGEQQVLNRVGSRNIIGEEALMFKIWASPEKFLNKDMILFANNRDDLAEERFTDRFDKLSEIAPLELKTGWSKTRTYYYRVGYNYKK